MLPDLSLLLSLVLGLYALDFGGGGAPDPWTAAGGTAGAVLAVIALCRMGSDRALRALGEGEEDVALASLRWVLLWPFLGWAAALFAFDWGSFVGALVPRAWFLLPHLLLFAPLCLMVGSGWIAAARVLAQSDPRAAAPRDAVRRGLQRNALVLLPLLLLVAVQELFYVLDALEVPGFRTFYLWHEAFPDVEIVLVLALVTTITWFAPAAARRMLGAQPLPDGEARRQIESLCEAIGVRCRDFLLWKTGGRVANAMVVGLTRRTRYVFVTDALLQHLPMPEVLAVVAHEAGHIRLKHLPVYLGLTIAALLLMRSVEEFLVPGLPGGGQLLLSLLFLAFFWFGMLGWLSRRFERQADVFGADHAASLEPGREPMPLPDGSGSLPYGAAMMIQALVRIAARHGPGSSHRHGPISERVQFLAAQAARPEVRRAYDEENRRLRRLLWGFVLAALASTAARVPAGVDRGGANLAFQEGVEASAAGLRARDEGDAAAARGHFERARSRFLDAAARQQARPDDVRMRAVAAIATFNAADLAIHQLGLDAEARREFEAALGLLGPLDSPGAAELRFQARIELGRLALRDAPAAADPVERAKSWLALAQEVPESQYGGRFRAARARLLASAIRLRDPDPGIAAQARADLESQTHPAEKGEAWAELARDAADEVRRAPPR